MNRCNAVRSMTINGCNAVRSMTMHGCSSVRSMTIHGCNGAMSMTMHGCNGVKSMTRVITLWNFDNKSVLFLSRSSYSKGLMAHRKDFLAIFFCSVSTAFVAGKLGLNC